MKNIILSILVLTLTSCASYYKGQMGESVDGKPTKDMIVAGDIDNQLSTEHYTVLNFDFGNNTKEWIRIKKARVDFGTASKKT